MKNSESIQTTILDLFRHKHIRLTPLALDRSVQAILPKSQRHQVRTIVRQLVDQGVLTYTNPFSTSFLELNRNRIVQVSHRISLGPLGFAYAHPGPGICINLNDALSFGNGEHPTTQLCLQGLDFAIAKIEDRWNDSPNAALDIGTGTGILAIAAAMLGTKRVVGLDRDPIACYEAKKNATLNGIGDSQLEISEASFGSLYPAQFTLVMANLRPPTLIALFGEMKQITASEGFWVLSGFRPAEVENLTVRLEKENGRIAWKSQSKNWGAVVIHWSPKDICGKKEGF